MSEALAVDPRIRRCRTCAAPVIWVVTAAGKNMPCDAETVGPEEWQFDAAKHRSHFATCPQAAEHRRSR